MKKVKTAPVKLPNPTLSASEIKLKKDNERLIERLELLEKRTNWWPWKK